MMETKDDNVEKNPWSVDQLEEFLYFCCPECDEKSQHRELFVSHALQQHTRSREFLKQDGDEITLKEEKVPDTPDERSPEPDVEFQESNDEKTNIEALFICLRHNQPTSGHPMR